MTRLAGKMTVQGEQIDGEYAIVRATLPLTSGQEMPIDYRMHRVDGRCAMIVRVQKK